VWYTGFRTKNTITIKQEVRNMKKRLLSMLLAAVMTVSFVGCSGSGTSSDSSSSGDNYTKEVKIDNVTLYLPEDAVESNEDNSSDNLTWYKTSFGKISLLKTDLYTGDWHSDLTANVFADGAKSKEKILIGDEKALMYVEDFKSQPAYWLNFNSSEHCINIIILSNTSEENAKEEYEKFLKHISIDSSVPTVTTTTTETTPSARDEFNKKYGNLPTWKDVKYDPMSYIGKKFTITDATYELDDYYNYNYRDTEAKYFVFSAETTGSYSDRWYVYADRKEFDWLFKQLKERNLKGNIVVKAQFKDGTKNGLVTLVDTE
jgi:hypothetical protein